MNGKRSQNSNEKISVNWWKWAFLLLTSLIIMTLFFFIRALQPVLIQESELETRTESKKEVSLISTITTEDAETVMNSAIEAMIIDENISYEVIIDNQLEIHSNVQLFNLKIPYTLFFDPYVTEKGNLQLRADAIELASFSLPVSAVLSLFSKELELPSYVGVDSAAKIILLNFTELSAQHDVSVAMSKVDLENNEIQLKLSVNHATLIGALKFDEK